MPQATLAGVTLDSWGRISWKMVAGPTPSFTVILMDIDSAESILGQARVLKTEEHNFSLTFEDEGDSGSEAKFIEIKGILILGGAPGDNKFTKRVILTDKRWLWTRRRIIRGFNIRRRSSLRKRLAGEGNLIPVILQQDVADIDFKEWSKLDGRNWTPEEAIANVMEELSVNPEDEGEKLFEFDVSNTLGARIELESFELDDTGTGAISRLLRYLPAAEVWVNYDGKVIFYNKFTGNERIIATKSGQEIIGSGHIDFILNTNVRPRAIHILFTREHEVRFDFEQKLTVPITQEDAGDPLEARTLENVMPVPDPVLFLGKDNIEVNQGTWMDIDKILEAWEKPENNTGVEGKPRFVPVKLTNRLIRRHWWNGGDLNFWGNLASSAETAAPDVFWMGRINAVKQNFRQTFRIAERWVDKTRAFLNQRVSILDTETGIRAPSTVYAGYSLLTTTKGMVLSSAFSTLLVNVPSFSQKIDDDGNPTGKADDKLANAKPAEARLELIDADQGILRIDFQSAPSGLFFSIIPSMTNNIFRSKISDQRLKNKFGNPFVLSRDQVFKAKGDGATILTEQHKVAVVLTAIPAAPNNTKQLYRIIIDSSDERLDRDQIGSAMGPPMEIRISPGIDTARFAWSDERAELIEEAFLNDPSELPDKQKEELEELLVNKEILEAISVAAADAIYLRLADRIHGSKTVRMLNDVNLTGHVESVSITLDRDGTTTTKISLPPEIKEFDFVARLPRDVQSTILKLVKPGGK